MKSPRPISLLAVSLALAVASLAAFAGTAGAKSTPCTATFTVLHNDRSGGVTLPAGLYRVSTSNLNCLTASNFFKTFLSKYTNAIPGWKTTVLGKGNGTYRRSSDDSSFTVKLIKAKGGKNSGGPQNSNDTCTTTFTVLHNHHSGGVTLPAGLYRITSATLSCSAASNFFETFLFTDNTTIPGWKSTVSGKGNGTYRRSSDDTSFTVKLIKAK
jgi:hypothetical protein